MTGQGTITGTSRWQSKGDTLETTISNLLRSLAEAIRPFLGLDSIAAVDPGDIEGLDELVDESVGNYIENEGVLTSSSFDPSDFDIVVSDDFGDMLNDYDVIREGEFDPSRYDLLDESDISYMVDEKVSSEVESWIEDNLEDAIESASVGASGVDYTSDEFLDAVEKAVKATLAGITFTVQANLCTSDDPTNHQGDTCPVHEGEVHLDGHSGDDVVVAGV